MTQETFIYLLRCGISDTVPERRLIPPGTDFGEIADMAYRQTVVGIIADAMSRLDLADASYAAAAHRLQMRAYAEVQTNVRMNSVLTELLGLLGAQGIDCVLLKGQGVATCYPAPLLRQCGDIDIYVGEEQYERAMQYAHSVLDPLSSDNDDHDVHYGFGYRGVSVELHRRAMRHEWGPIDRRLQEWTVREMTTGRRERVTIDGVEVMLPPVSFNAFFLFYHIWYHFLFEGVGLRQICDFTLYMRRHAGEIDHEALSEVLRWTHLQRQWQMIAGIAVEALGLPAEMVPLYDPRTAAGYTAVLDEIIRSGNFGFYTEGTRVPEQEGLVCKFRRVATFTVRNHVSKLKYDRTLNIPMLFSKLCKKTAILAKVMWKK